MSFSFTARIYFGPQHLMSAAHLARATFDHEQKAEDVAVIASASAAVMLSAFSLDAMVNELVSDVRDKASARPALNLPASAASAIEKEAKDLIGSSNTRSKIQKVLGLAGAKAFDEAKDPYESVNALFKFRNALVHYEVTSDVIASTIPGTTAYPYALQSLLNKRFVLNPKYVPGGATGVISTWHQQLLSHGAAVWAVNTAKSMFEEFNQRLGLPPPFDGLNGNLNTKP